MLYIEEKKVRKYFENYSTDCTTINKKIGKLQTALEKFIAFDEYSGKEAESAKAFIKKVEKPMAEDIKVALKELKKMQNTLLEEFNEEVDSSKRAVIYTDKLDIIKQDFEDFAEDFNTYNQEVEAVYEILENDCSKFGTFSKPDETQAKKTFFTLNASSDSFSFALPIGLVSSHKKDLQSFEYQHSNDISGTYFETICNSLETCIDTCNAHLDSDEPVSSIYNSLNKVYYNSDMEELDKYDASKVKDYINWLDSLTDGKLKKVIYKLCDGLVSSGLIEDFIKLYEGLPEGMRGNTQAVINLLVAFYAKHEEELYNLPIWHEVLAELLGFVYDPETKCYHTKEGSLQNAMGFGDGFDKIGPLLGMDLAETPVIFEYNNRFYLFEPWVGKYGYGTCSGGEIGIYSLSREEYQEFQKNGDMVFYQCAKEYEQFKMQYVIRNKNTKEVISSKDSSQGNGDGTDFWGLAIKTNDHTDKDDLEMVGTISHDDVEYLNELCKNMNQDKINAKLNEKKKTISFTYTYSENSRR
ncbi:DUF4474 domain-containing protein [Anaerosacchariphilus polymeriproducens]|uniref:DUF4474 domain-containing protein n=1 Tax=Anaerosacchariphilus polymeriproducens TaxID=1812858 RepID=A0A371ARZ0_9FIRM|nr:DUF4474 domain-containing protein [Anaerosacchariphilus polymeriproducens]RDU22324.1 DUF4474 domain-containing protein [Anaerosacchariphilus polymeriproducens]